MQIEQLGGRPDGRVAQVPPGVGGHRRRDPREPQHPPLVVVGIEGGHAHPVSLPRRAGRVEVDASLVLETLAVVEPFRLLDDRRVRDAGQGPPARVRLRPSRQRTVRDAGMHARRRLDPLGHPSIEGQEQRLAYRRVLVGVRGHLPAVGRGAGRAVLGAADHVDPHLGREHGVPLAEGVGDDERPAAVPVLRGRVEVHDPRHRPARPGAAQQPVGAAGERVGLVAVGEREEVDRIEVAQVLGRGAGGRREAVVEEPATGARHRRHDAVEHLPALLVRVEPLVEERPQGPAALRPPLADHALSHRRAVRPPERVHVRPVVLEERDEVAHGREPGPLDHRSPRLVDQLVDRPGLEAAGEGHLQLDESAPLVPPVVAGPEAPPVARHRLAGVLLAQPAGQGGVGQPADEGLEGELVPVADGQAVGRGIGRQLGPDRPDDRYQVVRVERHRRLEPEQIPRHRHLGDPAARHGDVAALEEERLAAPRPPAAVVHDVEHGGTGEGAVDRRDDLDVAVELHAAPLVGDREVEIDDAPVGGGVRVEGVDHAPAQPLVGADLRLDPRAERLSGDDVEADDLGGGRGRRPPRRQRQPHDPASRREHGDPAPGVPADASRHLRRRPARTLGRAAGRQAQPRGADGRARGLRRRTVENPGRVGWAPGGAEGDDGRATASGAAHRCRSPS